jgi:K+ transporter
LIHISESAVFVTNCCGYLGNADFISMAVNANSATDYFHLPTGRVVEVGTKVTI